MTDMTRVKSGHCPDARACLPSQARKDFRASGLRMAPCLRVLWRRVLAAVCQGHGEGARPITGIQWAGADRRPRDAAAYPFFSSR